MYDVRSSSWVESWASLSVRASVLRIVQCGEYTMHALHIKQHSLHFLSLVLSVTVRRVRLIVIHYM